MMDNIDNIPVCNNNKCYFDNWLVNENESLLNNFIQMIKNDNSTLQEIKNKWNEIEDKFFDWCENNNVQGEL